jgi:3-isopropylmalate/(R)-2-methylmalate dehydratase small subunit
MSFIYEGRCWKFGDMLACDGAMMPIEFVYGRESRPEVLRAHLFEGLDKDFASKIAEGDIIVAGRRFGVGHAHPQAAMGIAAAKLAVIAESIPYLNFRNLVNAAVPFLSDAQGVGLLCDTGDRLRVDFATGHFENLTRGVTVDYQPLPSPLLATIELGGWKPMVRSRLERIRASEFKQNASPPT